MKVYADSAFRMGQAHEVCQDYATTGSHGNVTVAALSDGCSGAPDTDIGSRALARSAVRLLSMAPDTPGNAVERLTAADAVRCAAALDADRSAILGTLFTVTLAGQLWKLNCWGDGFVAVRHRDEGTYSVDIIRWPSDQPYYPAYALSGHVPPGEPSVENVVFDTNATESRAYSTRLTTPLPAGTRYTASHDTECWDTVILGSDGWSSFLERQSRRPVSIETVLSKLLPLRSGGPAFIRRRMGAFVRGLDKLGWIHGDDLSLAAIQVKEETCGSD